MLDQTTLDMISRRGVSEIIIQEEFLELLQKGKPLRLKMGFDPSRPDIHLGHVVGLRKLRQLQDLGHKVILIVGDWTAQIGDPSGQSLTRPMLTHQEVSENSASYLSQFFRVVDRSRTETVLQSEWFGKFTLGSIIDLTSRFTLAQFLERDDFAKRFQTNRPIALTEFLYPLLQAYDSVAIESDVEFGGTDQKFNLLVGRQLQSMMGQRPQQCFLMPMLVGTDGVQKMSKSLDNYIALNDSPNDMYGKVMSIGDNLLMDYFTYLTNCPDQDLDEMRHAMKEGSINPMEVKKRLALEITSEFHDKGEAVKAQQYFEHAFQRRATPQEIPEVGFRVEASGSGFRHYFDRLLKGGSDISVMSATPGHIATVDLILAVGLATSRSEAKRLLSQGGVEIDQEKIEATSVVLRDGIVIKAGKRRFARLVDLDKKN